MLNRCFILALCLPFLLPPPVYAGNYSSYERLKGRRLTRFQKSAGKSEYRNHLSLVLPLKALEKKRLKTFGKRRRFRFFDYKKMAFYVEATNPYFIQAMRKAQKNRKGNFLIKGRVMRLKRDGQWRYALKIHTIQKCAKIS